MNFPEFQPPAYCYRAKVIKVVDGDTIDVQIDVGFDTHIYKRLRLLGVDTWELRGDEREKGLVAKERMEHLVLEKDVFVQTEMDGEGKYGRVLAWVWLETESEHLNVNNLLIEEGHGTEIDY